MTQPEWESPSGPNPTSKPDVPPTPSGPADPQHGPPPGPYGQPQYPPYGQPPYPQYGQPPYPQYSQPPYGQPHGHPGMPMPYGTGPARPGTVIAGGVIAIVMTSLALLFQVILLAVTFTTEVGFLLDFLGARGAVMVVLLTLIALSVVAIVAAARAMAGSNAWRITLVVLASVAAVFSLFAVLGSLDDGEGGGIAVSLLWLAGAVAVVVLMFVGGANAWYAARSAQR